MVQTPVITGGTAKIGGREMKGEEMAPSSTSDSATMGTKSAEKPESCLMGADAAANGVTMDPRDSDKSVFVDEDMSATTPPVEVTPNDKGVRVASIMQSYLSLQESGKGSHHDMVPEKEAMAHCNRCKAMMEVVRKDEGKWSVSKFVAEHNHPLETLTEEGSMAGSAPVVGMEFDSVEAAKQFYYGYAEKLRFRPRTGSNRRSAGNNLLIMQRFLCSRGSYLTSRSKKVQAAKLKRGAYKRSGKIESRLDVGISGKKVEPDGDGDDGNVERKASTAGDRNTGRNTRSELGDGGIRDSEIEVTETGVGENMEKKNMADVGNGTTATANTQSQLLRELGVKVARYSTEERVKILNKYLSKRKTRPAGGRPPKVASRQALAERRKRGTAGRFLASGTKLASGSSLGEMCCNHPGRSSERDEEQSPSKKDETVQTEPDPPTEAVSEPRGEPKVGMVFDNEDQAYDFYVSYAVSMGFSIRKGWCDKMPKNITKSRAFVCSREGFHPKNVATDSKKRKPETRTGCQAHMTIKVMTSGKYVVADFISNHNHELDAPVMVDIQILRSQKLLAKVQSQSCEQPHCILIPAKYRNYLRTKRMKDMQPGDAGEICEFLRKKKGENPSFYYAIQVDEDDSPTNIFWADAKSIMDYYYFSDVVCFDARYRIHDYDRPLALFVGTNHHKQLVIFGAAMVYDESVESFKWLFETFKSAMSGKEPKTVYIDDLSVVWNTIGDVWPGTVKRLSSLHLYETATKTLADCFRNFDSFGYDIGRCFNDYEEEEEFLSAWSIMLERYGLKDNEWLCKLYDDRSRWALPYGREAFSGDIMSTLRNDTTIPALKDLLKAEVNLTDFLNHFGTSLEGKRFVEQQADYFAQSGPLRAPQWGLLLQAAHSYTPAIYEILRLQVELLYACMVYSCEEVGAALEFQITVKDRSKSCLVSFDPSDCTAVCSCKFFERVGVPCCHILKIYHLRNLQELPQNAILKRWRRDAKSECLRDNHQFLEDENLNISLSRHYNSMCRLLYNIAAKAAESAEACSLVENQFDQLLEQVERILQARNLEKAPSNASAKGYQFTQNDSNVSQKASGKKNKTRDLRHRHQNVLETDKHKKARQDDLDAALGCEGPSELNNLTVPPRNPPNPFESATQLLQAPYIPGQQFGLGSLQGFHGMTQFSQMQEPSSASLQLQQFGGSTQSNQGIPPPDMHPLQFFGNNPQLGQQNTDQSHYTIPVWDFL